MRSVVKRRNLCWVDVDDVLADFQGGALAIANKLLNETRTIESFNGWDMFGAYTKEQQTTIFKDCEEEGFCFKLGVLPGAVDGMKELRKHADIYICTAPFHSKTWVHERNAWLKEHFGIDRKEVIYTWSKFLVKTDACLDDKPDNVHKWVEAHPTGLPMIWPNPTTRNLDLGALRVKDWDEVIRRIVDHKPTV